ncbi:YciI family protein [Paraglaciecola sp. 20A4]|uniref:YciI family protein n=1 Tax=Paraglaciecola sp. 20A4 TaxID=2687288 RepID=UPI00140C98B6|nr:YciI family protein [Paraglaciecola sp. 20A4]
MLVHFNCLDKDPSMQVKRMQYLPAHLAWVEEKMVHIRVAGPLKISGEIMGSLYIIEADSTDQAKDILFSDPYYHAGIWASIDVQEFNAYAGSWVGGKNWPT